MRKGVIAAPSRGRCWREYRDWRWLEIPGGAYLLRIGGEFIIWYSQKRRMNLGDRKAALIAPLRADACGHQGILDAYCSCKPRWRGQANELQCRAHGAIAGRIDPRGYRRVFTSRIIKRAELRRAIPRDARRGARSPRGAVQCTTCHWRLTRAVLLTRFCGAATCAKRSSPTAMLRS